MSRKTPVLPRMIEMIVAPLGPMSDPAAVSFDVRRVRMTRLIAEIALFFTPLGSRTFCTTGGRRPPLRNVTASRAPLFRARRLSALLMLRGSAFAVPLPAVTLVLREKYRTDSDQPCKQPSRLYHYYFSFCVQLAAGL